MINDTVRIRLSWGLIALAVIHAIAFGVFSYVMHPKKPTGPENAGWELPSHYAGDSYGARKFQAIEDLPPVNRDATNEIKQQCIDGTCYTPQTTSGQIRPGMLINGERVWSVGPTRTLPRVTNTSTPTKTPVQPAAPVITPPSDRLLYPTQPRTNPEAQPSAKQYELSIFVDGSQQAQQLVAWFDADPQLKSLREKCNFQVYTASNALYRARYAEIVPPNQFPVVLFQDATGGHIHAAGRSMIPATAAELYSDLGEGYQLWKQAKQGSIEQTGALITKGYSWDDSIRPTMMLSEQDCPDGYCPTPDASWRPFDRVRPDRDGGGLFDLPTPVRSAFFWANVNELATIGLFVIAAFLGFFIMTRRST